MGSETFRDAQCLRLLELLAQLEEKKKELEVHMQNGFFDMAKARYAVGITTVSKLHYPQEMTPCLTVDFCESPNGKKFCLTSSPKLSNFTDANESATLRKRAPTQKIKDDDKLEDTDSASYHDQKTPLNNVNSIRTDDPIRWFSVFAPQSLRSAQKSFLQAIKDTCDISTLQIQLDEARKKYRDCLKQHDELPDCETELESLSIKN